jgi:hypothetical protein
MEKSYCLHQGVVSKIVIKLSAKGYGKDEVILMSGQT